VPDPVETTDPEGVDFAWVMQTTFVVTILVGAPIVALASIPVALPTWGARASFAIRMGAIVWIVVAVGTFLYARREAGEKRSDPDLDSGPDPEAGDAQRDRGDAGSDGDTGQGGDRDDGSAASPEPHSTPSERPSDT
jgi:hypothetical protein